MQRRAKHQAGIGLVEVLVAAAIFSVGVLAIVKLQGEFLRGSDEANARAVAVQLAQQKIDDLRSFGTSAAGSFAFTDICTPGAAGCAASANGARVGGGSIAADTSTSNGTNVVGNVDYALTWTVSDYYFASPQNANATTAKTATTPVPSGSATAQKQVTVTVSWTDRSGAQQSVQLTDIINSMAPDVAAGLSGGPNAGAGASSPGPQVTYTPSASPGVVPVSVGDQSGVHRETLTPTVEASGRTTFNAYTYNAANKLVREEEFETVACTCRFNGTGSSTDADSSSDSSAGAPRTPGHAEWSTVASTFKDVAGDKVSKPKGCVQGGGSNCDTTPESFCGTCCRDHHDAGNTAVDSTGAKYCDPANGITDRCYDPFRHGDWDASGRHQHYSTALVPVTSGEYIESCRFKRIDGFWRLYQDWHQIKQPSFPLSVLEDSSLEAQYVAYIKDLVNEHLTEGAVAGQTLTSPPTRPAVVTFDASNPTHIATAATEQETARGVYLDYMSATHLAAVLAKKAQGVDYLVDVPFYEIELTPFATWTSANTAKVTVGPLTVHGGSGYTISTGQIRGIAATNTTAVTSSIKKSNSGIAFLTSPDGVDFASGLTNADNVKNGDTIAVCVDCTTTTSTSTTSSTTSTTTSTTSSTAATTSTTAASTSTTSSTTSTSTTTTVAGTTTTTVAATKSIVVTVNAPSSWSISAGAVTASYTSPSSGSVSCTAPSLPASAPQFTCTVPLAASAGTITFSSGQISKTTGGTTTTLSCTSNFTAPWPAGSAATITVTKTTGTGHNPDTCP